MPITHLHSFLIHPGKGLEAKALPVISRATIDLSGKLFDLLDRIYKSSHEHCKTNISFTTDTKTNDARKLVLEYANRPRSDTGHKLAKRLQLFTDGTSGMGLLFLIRGQEGNKIKTLISRFPADTGILANDANGKLNVEFLEKVFMKNSNKYKAACYEDASLANGYWRGVVVDHQIQYGVVRTVSDYWVKDFLASDCLTTPALGSSRLAKMFDKAIKSTSDTSVKDQLASAAKLIPNLDGKKISADIVAKQFGLLPTAVDMLKAEATSNSIYTEEFVLDKQAFSDILSFESIELDTGAILTAPIGQFDQVFKEEVVDQKKGLRIYRAQGIVSDQRFRKAKP